MAAPYISVYGEVNNGAHRKAADLIGAPALVWVQTLWNPEHDKNDKEKRAERVEKYLRSLRNHLARTTDNPVEPPPGEIIVGPTDRVRVITISFI